MARYLGEFARAGLSTSPAAAAATRPSTSRRSRRRSTDAPPREFAAPRDAERRARPASAPSRPPTAEVRCPLRLSGSQPFTQQPGVYIMIGERTNVAGSPKFAKLIKEGQVRGGRQRRAAAGRERRQRHRHLHGRGDDRRRRGDDPLPAAARQRARGRQGPVHGRLLEVGGHRGRAEVPAGQGHRQLDLAEGGRGQVPRERAHRAQVRRGRGGHGLRRAGPGRDLRGQDPHLRARLPHPGRRGRLPARGHHLRSEHPHRRHRHGGAQQLRGRLHQRHALDQGEPAARQGQRRRVEHLVQLPRQQQGPRGDALGVPVPRDRGRHGHGHRQRRACSRSTRRSSPS